MLFKVRAMAVACVLASGLLFVSCTDAEKGVEEAVTSEIPSEPSSTDIDDMSLSGSGGAFAAEGDVVYFDFDDYTLNSAARSVVDSIAKKLKKGSAAVVVEGHCDERGSVEYNIALGNRRAESVKKYLVQLGVKSANISTISYGKERPAADGQGESIWARNRRAVFVFNSN